MNIGIFAIDPGGSTGLAWTIAPPEGSIEHSLEHRINHGSTTITGGPRQQIREVAQLWSSFYNQCVRNALLPPERVWLICEDYIFVGSNTYAGDSAAISTALIWGIEGYRMGRRDEWSDTHRREKKDVKMPEMIMQSASQAKGYATNARLKEWGVWVVGREHERSAWQHIAYFLQHYKLTLNG